MASVDAQLQVVFNGEIYNYQALRAELEKAGADFRTQSDTEVLLHGYRHWGLQPMLERLRGMYAFALFDQSTTQLHMARDPYGIKPLYYADDGKALHFASSVRALKQVSQLDLSVDPAAKLGFYLWASVPEPRTWYRGIRALEAGHVLSVSVQGLGPARAHARLHTHYAPRSAATTQIWSAMRYANPYART
jgi:asparagine synthase (glutamine-hydrolysing)